MDDLERVARAVTEASWRDAALAESAREGLKIWLRRHNLDSEGQEPSPEEAMQEIRDWLKKHRNEGR